MHARNGTPFALYCTCHCTCRGMLCFQRTQPHADGPVYMMLTCGLQVVEKLAQVGANLNIVDNHGGTPLMWCV